MRILYLIPARGGSKRLPDKNIRLLAGKPLIAYSIEFAKEVADAGDTVCVSTDSTEIAQLAGNWGAHPPFIRPAELATDTAGSHEVILHAIGHYEKEGKQFDAVVLLQPTSPFRKKDHLIEMIAVMEAHPQAEMIVSVQESKNNPYFDLFEETGNGYLVKSKQGDYTRKQDCPPVYAYNGSVYLMRVSALKDRPIHRLSRIIKYVMEDRFSLDIDTPEDFQFAEYLLEKGFAFDTKQTDKR